jgi:hypothetical protein
MVDFHEYVTAGFRDEGTGSGAFGDDARRTFKACGTTAAR